jgi:uncharacterized surface protein with fasciclin (FAS1) repeats
MEFSMRFMTTPKALAVAAAIALSGGALTQAAHAAEHGKSKTIVETAAAAGQFETLLAAVDAAGLTATLEGEGPFTVFAPTDEAFAQLPEGTVETLLQPENKDRLVQILTYHVVSGEVTSDAVSPDEPAELTTVEGQTLTVAVEDGSVMVNDTAEVVKADVQASNGVIHAIDTVLMPE